MDILDMVKRECAEQRDWFKKRKGEYSFGSEEAYQYVINLIDELESYTCISCQDTGSVPSTDQPGMMSRCPDCQGDEADHVQQYP